MDSKNEEKLRYWYAVLDELSAIEAGLPKVYPEALPPETEAGFWWDVYRMEIAGRDGVSAWIDRTIGGESPAIGALDGFFVRRRIEWASQLVAHYLERDGLPPWSRMECVRFLLIESWEREGCLGLEAHAERDGRAP